MARSAGWKTLVLILLASSYALTGSAFYNYHWINKTGADGSELDETTISSFNKMINDLDVQVSNLDVLTSQLQMNTPSGRMQTPSAELAKQHSKLFFAQEAYSPWQVQLTLQIEREKLQARLGESQTTNMSGLFLYGSGPSYVIVGGLYANTGVATAVSAELTLTFYSQPGGLGTVLCATTRELGNVSGQSVLIIGSIACGSGMSRAASGVFEFKWSL